MSYTIEIIDFETEQALIERIREEVFVKEQKVPPELEWDGLDPSCRHALVREDGERPVGTGRLTPEGVIGRMAVLAEDRGRGVGDLIMRELIATARGLNLTEISLSAQTHAIRFYERYGFRVEGEIFMDAGIPHRRMVSRSNADADSVGIER